MDRKEQKSAEKVFMQLEWINKRLYEKTISASIKNVAEDTGISPTKLSSLDSGAGKLTIREFLVLCSHFNIHPSSVIPDKPRFTPKEIYDTSKN